MYGLRKNYFIEIDVAGEFCPRLMVNEYDVLFTILRDILLAK